MARIQPSMNRTGGPDDHAIAESFIRTLKQEQIDATDHQSLAPARAAIGRLIEEAYHHQPLYSALIRRSPVEFEANQPWPAARQPMPSDQPAFP